MLGTQRGTCPQRVVSGHDISGLNADITDDEEGVDGGAKEKGNSSAYAVENQHDWIAGGIYTAALIEFPVAIILLYTGRLAAQG